MDWEHEFQVYAARGWAVLYTNPRGSGGYGQKFARAIKGDRAGPAGGISRAEKPSIDVINGIEAVLKKYPWIDPTRLGVTGLSYGGFLTNWLVSHTTLFRAAVTVNGPVNHVSQDGTRFTPFPRYTDFGGTLWEAYDTYWNSAPLKYAQHVKTPTLILQSEHDFMVPLEQGEQWFRALKYFDVITEMVVFPGANHFGLNSYAPTSGREPRTVVEALNWRIYWFDRFLNDNQSAKPPTVSTTESRPQF
jgi:dipeptidyl aminopeptidase/acylaminoacyl peptidase